MYSHDVLAYAFASAATAQIRGGDAPWDSIFSGQVFVTNSGEWPLPDFVIYDQKSDLALAAEFKPPNQSKREYLTGLGQTVAYTRDFEYGLLVVPTFSDDGYDIGAHIKSILAEDVYHDAPIGVLTYDPASADPDNPAFSVERFPNSRISGITRRVHIGSSFYAKWREISPMEMGRFLEYLYEERRRPSNNQQKIRDRAFERLWTDAQAGALRHWGGGTRHISNTKNLTEGWRKNYRNFLAHIGWIESDGALTAPGFRALELSHIYGSESVIFLDNLAKTLLIEGKHLVILNEITEFQNRYLTTHGHFPDEPTWRDEVEQHLDDRGFLKRNAPRSQAAKKKVARESFKAEKQIWRNLGLLVPHGKRGGRSFHPGRGLILNWKRITDLIQQSSP